MTRALLVVILATLSLADAAKAEIEVIVRPARPTVGTLITADFRLPPGQRLVVEPSADVEIVALRGNVVQFRSFRTGGILLRAAMQASEGSIPLRPLKIDITSVLAENDSLTPAPLIPPRELLTPTSFPQAISIAAVCAGFLWIGLYLLGRRMGVAQHATAGSPDAAAEFLATLAAIRSRGLTPDETYDEIAAATRHYLYRVSPQCGQELTSTEILAVVRQDAGAEAEKRVSLILSAGDLAKFSPWGATATLLPRVDSSAVALAKVYPGATPS